jgi:hypothetical protein
MEDAELQESVNILRDGLPVLRDDQLLAEDPSRLPDMYWHKDTVYRMRRVCLARGVPEVSTSVS